MTMDGGLPVGAILLTRESLAAFPTLALRLCRRVLRYVAMALHEFENRKVKIGKGHTLLPVAIPIYENKWLKRVSRHLPMGVNEKVCVRLTE